MDPYSLSLNKLHAIGLSQPSAVSFITIIPCLFYPKIDEKKGDILVESGTEHI